MYRVKSTLNLTLVIYVPFYAAYDNNGKFALFYIMLGILYTIILLVIIPAMNIDNTLDLVSISEIRFKFGSKCAKWTITS